jgi:hypothetical protein
MTQNVVTEADGTKPFACFERNATHLGATFVLLLYMSTHPNTVHITFFVFPCASYFQFTKRFSIVDSVKDLLMQYLIRRLVSCRV